MKRFLSILTALILCCTALCVGAEGKAVTYSPRCLAIMAAQRALFDNYGITEDMNDYFIRITEESEDGSYVITWHADADNSGELAWLLGTYTARVSADGQVEIVWTHDGVSTDGGFSASAWGAPQLTIVMEEVRTEFQYTDSVNAAREAALAAGYVPGESEEYDNGYYNNDIEHYESTYSPEELDRIARDAVAEAYPDADAAGMTYWDDEYPFAEFELWNRPVCVIIYSHWGDDETEEWEWSAGDGYYMVAVNLENGAVEEILHTSGLCGNG